MNTFNDELINQAGNTALDDLLSVFNITDKMIALKLRKLLDYYIVEYQEFLESGGMVDLDANLMVRFTDFYSYFNLRFHDMVVFYARQEKSSFIL